MCIYIDMCSLYRKNAFGPYGVWLQYPEWPPDKDTRHTTILPDWSAVLIRQPWNRPINRQAWRLESAGGV